MFVCVRHVFTTIHYYISTSSPGLKSFVGKDLNLIVMAWCETCGPWEGGRLVALGMMVGDLWALESGVLGDLWALELGLVGDLWACSLYWVVWGGWLVGLVFGQGFLSDGDENYHVLGLRKNLP